MVTPRYRVQLPSGIVVEFPDDWTEEQVIGRLEQISPRQATQPKEPTE